VLKKNSIKSFTDLYTSKAPCVSAKVTPEVYAKRHFLRSLGGKEKKAIKVFFSTKTVKKIFSRQVVSPGVAQVLEYL
jgi:hypothetical protein